MTERRGSGPDPGADARRLADWFVDLGERDLTIEPLVARMLEHAPESLGRFFDALRREPVCALVTELAGDGWRPSAGREGADDDGRLAAHVAACVECSALLAAIEESAGDPREVSWLEVTRADDRWVGASADGVTGVVDTDVPARLGPWTLRPVAPSDVPVRFSTADAPLLLELVLHEVATVRVSIEATHRSTPAKDEWLIRVERGPASTAETEEVPLWVGLGDAESAGSMHQVEAGKRTTFSIPPPPEPRYLHFEWLEDGDLATRAVELPVRTAREERR